MSDKGGTKYADLSETEEAALIGLMSRKEQDIYLADVTGASDDDVADAADTSINAVRVVRSKIRSRHIPEAREIARLVEDRMM